MGSDIVTSSPNIVKAAELERYIKVLLLVRVPPMPALSRSGYAR